MGRGTDAPFEQIGADWIKGVPLAELLNGRYLPGVRVYPTRFRPTASNFADRDMEGVRFVVTDRESFDSVLFGLELATALESCFQATSIGRPANSDREPACPRRSENRRGSEGDRDSASARRPRAVCCQAKCLPFVLT